jgi:hypothetical protein
MSTNVEKSSEDITLFREYPKSLSKRNTSKSKAYEYHQDDPNNSALYADPKEIGTWKPDPNDPYNVWKTRLISSIWLTLSILLLWITDIVINIVYLHETVHLPSLITGCVFSAIFIAVFVYLNIWIPCVKKKKVDYHNWKESAPKMIPIATLCGLLSTVCFISAFWPIYGWFCMPLFFVWTMGALTVLAWF